MGALEFKPARSPRVKRATAVDLQKLVRASREALIGHLDGDDPEMQAAIANLIQVGTSAGGARAKAVIAWDPVSQEIRSGQLPADDGFEHVRVLDIVTQCRTGANFCCQIFHPFVCLGRLLECFPRAETAKPPSLTLVRALEGDLYAARAELESRPRSPRAGTMTR